MRVFPPRIQFSLRAKLTLLIEALVVVLVLGHGIVTTMRERETLQGELQKRGLALASDLAKSMEGPMLSRDLAALRRFVKHVMEEDYVRHAIVLDPYGKVIMHNDLEEVGKDYRDDLSVIASSSKEAGCIGPYGQEKGELFCDIFVPIQVSDIRLGTIRLGYSYVSVEKEMTKARQQIFLVGLVTIVIGAIASYLLATFISSPIIRVTDATKRVADGELDIPLAVRRHDEIGTLADSFNKMAQDLAKHRKHLEELVEERTAELEAANEQLQKEIAERKASEEQLKQSQERLRDLASHLESIREEERSRIAREIHDELGQALTALKMDIHWVGQRLSENQGQLLEKTKAVSRLIDTTTQSVQRISSELRPGLLDDLGLSAAIEWQAAEFQKRTNIACEIMSDPEDITLHHALSTAVFRVFQEALTNIARHANASKIQIVLRKTPDTVELTVRDNGAGITEEQISDERSFGLIGMRERVHHFGGKLTIFGASSKGTTVSARIPLHGKGSYNDKDNGSRRSRNCS